MDFRRTWALVQSDLYRYSGDISLRCLTRHVLLNEGFRYSVSLRMAAGAANSGRTWLSLPSQFWLRRLSHKYGISIGARTKIGPGLYIGHFGGVVVSPNATIGRDCNLSQGVTIGVTNRGRRAGAPTIGNRVYIGPGAIVIGGITVGDDVAIGANCVVTKDVPPNSVVVGIPGRVISGLGSEGYVNRTDYRTLLPALDDGPTVLPSP